VIGEDHDGLTAAERWIEEQTSFWNTRADALTARLSRPATTPGTTAEPRSAAPARTGGSKVTRKGTKT
jgi:hypothetical protein